MPNPAPFGLVVEVVLLTMMAVGIGLVWTGVVVVLTVVDTEELRDFVTVVTAVVPTEEARAEARPTIPRNRRT